ncbi:hypothetical protein BDV26DRAFT_303778 [Aspergillus bertholletiae]|uniref:Uncharacterized protein n=1 Tax=Aspergillus bertholletiae TaxID=1226010 RepID=A0A5N7BBU6_9EURO|nr:hypothetical protein BDV26DRAFT_303778 [Aspergillus bertholletiae]
MNTSTPSEHRNENTRTNTPRSSVSPSPSERTLADRSSSYFPSPVSSNNKTNPTSPKSLSSKANDHWVLEIASCCGSAGALVGIIVFLNAYNGKPSPDWPYGITVNSILSWLVQIFTALLLEPIAACLSQARWNNLSSSGCRLSDISLYDFASRGAFGCISLIWHSKFRTSACMGALVTILAIGTGPFVQQMVTVENRLALSSEPITVPRTLGIIEYLDRSPSLPQEVLAAIYSAILGGTTNDNGNLTQLSIAPNCPTGECEVPSFRSLAACSTCTDLTDLISTSCMDNWCEANSTFCQHSLPDGFTLNVTGYNGRYGNVVSKMSSRVGYYNASIIANFTSIYLAPGPDLAKATAQHCLVYWCVKTYTAGMHNNKPWEKLVDTWDDLEMPMSFGQNFTFHVPAKGNLTSSKFWVGIPFIKAWMYSKLNINASLQCNSVKTPYDEFRTPMIRYGIPEFCEKLAAGITTGIRLYNNTPASGTAWKMETQIHVRWAWAILPALLVVSTAIFLGMTALQTKSGGFDVWKSSPTPLVCATLDQRTQELVCSTRDPTEMEQSASQIRVKFYKEGSDGDGCWQLEMM